MKSLFALASLLAVAAARPHVEKRASNSSWWYPNMDHTTDAVRAYDPNLGNDFSYPIYMAVQPGDDIFQAITSNGPNNGQRDNMWGFNEPRVVYLAPGTYTLSQTLDIYTDTVIVGDAANPPTIAAASGFNGDNMILGGQDGSGNGGELHFSVQIKNVILDTTANAANANFNALSWRVAQNAALENVVIKMPSGVHTGIWMGQGSTISVADVRFEQGNIGFHYAGSQQAQLKNMYFFQNTIGLQIDGGNAITVYGCTFDTCGNPIIYSSGASFTAIIDGTATNSGTFFTAPNGVFPNFMIENLDNDNLANPIAVVQGNTVLGAASHVDTLVYGNTYGANPVYQTSPQQVTNQRPAALAPNGKYPVGVAPSYSDKTTADVINVKDSGANGGQTVKGDGQTDETVALNAVLQTCASSGKICFIPFGIYRVTDTLYVPPGSMIVGEAWSTISGFGNAFMDESNPKPVVMIGKDGETGSAVLQDLRFTVGQALPGAIVVQINMAGNNPTDVAIYNSLITIGGTRDTEINCSDEANCRSAYVGLHLAPSSSAYIENFWSWVADHASDDSNIGTRSAGKGGILVEATKGTWLVGVGTEHWWLYLLNLHNAENVLISFLQGETNYNQNSQSSAIPPAPFTPVSGEDPDFSWCGSGDGPCFQGIAEYINGGANIYHYASGAYNFNGGEQEAMYMIADFPQNLQWYGVTTHAATNAIRLPDGTLFGHDDGSDGFGGAWGGLVAAYLDHASTTPVGTSAAPLPATTSSSPSSSAPPPPPPPSTTPPSTVSSSSSAPPPTKTTCTTKRKRRSAH